MWKMAARACGDTPGTIGTGVLTELRGFVLSIYRSANSSTSRASPWPPSALPSPGLCACLACSACFKVELSPPFVIG